MPGSDPYLINPTSGWCHDLPGPCEPPDLRLIQRGIGNAINQVDSHYLEIPSPSLVARGLLIWVALLGFPVVGVALWFLATLLVSPTAASLSDLAILLGTGIGVTWFSIYTIRLDLLLPRDEPIRFNRSRQKVYIYHFRYSWLRPLSKSEWRVEVSVHNWEELWLEACKAYGSIEYGGLIQRVQLSVQQNRMSEKHYSRIFSHSIQTGEEYWAMIRLFMQQGLHALPPFQNPPQPREDEEMFYNIFWDYAPRVVWPADIDLESRTAANHGNSLPSDQSG